MQQSKFTFRFNRDLQIVRRSDPAFVNYLLGHWLYIKRKRAIHAQNDLVHFGNRPNNHIEIANRRVKIGLHCRDQLTHAIQKVWNHAGVLFREFEMYAFHHCDQHEIRECDFYVLHILARMTTYTATMAQRHLIGRIPRFPCENLNERKVNSFFQHIF